MRHWDAKETAGAFESSWPGLVFPQLCDLGGKLLLSLTLGFLIRKRRDVVGRVDSSMRILKCEAHGWCFWRGSLLPLNPARSCQTHSSTHSQVSIINSENPVTDFQAAKSKSLTRLLAPLTISPELLLSFCK